MQHSSYLPAKCLRYYGQDGNLKEISLGHDTHSADDDLDSTQHDTDRANESGKIDSDLERTDVRIADSSVAPMNNIATDSHSSSTHNYKTTLTKTLHGILRDSPELQQFDKLRCHLKNTPGSW